MENEPETKQSCLSGFSNFWQVPSRMSGTRDEHSSPSAQHCHTTHRISDLPHSRVDCALCGNPRPALLVSDCGVLHDGGEVKTQSPIKLCELSLICMHGLWKIDKMAPLVGTPRMV